ncbi:hypothetical protein BC628DRAFT_1414880 [Trametes gibbosa]|nr:hypothetical protein BC628DRAFT_1414880 [Trametes gibbosa]
MSPMHPLSDPPPRYDAITTHQRAAPDSSSTTHVHTTTSNDHWQTLNSEYAALPVPTRKRERAGGRCNLLATCIGAILLVMFLAQNVGLMRCPLNDVSAQQKAALRRQWAQEKAEWAAEQDAHRADVDTWTRERAEHAEELAGWQRDLEDWARRRAEEEAHRLELERRSQGVYWTEPLGDPNCHAYGTRTYYSWLRDLPGDLNWREVCFNMPPVVVHGRTFTTPDKCERNGKGETIGTWYVSGGEPACVPRWGDFSDKGCIPGKPGYRRFVAPIEAVARGSDAQMMCATTPATVQGTVYDFPTACEWWGKRMMGIWEVPNNMRWGSC